MFRFFIFYGRKSYTCQWYLQSMINNELKNTIRSAYLSLKKQPGFKSRTSQRLMIAEISNTLTDHKNKTRISIVEGPTGTGKTVAYLLACIPIALHLKKKLIITTATIALQEQLIHKDIPNLQNHSQLDFTYDIAKGRGRYLCPSLLAQQLGDNIRQTDFFNDTSAYINELKVLYNAFEKHEWNGDRDTWPSQITNDLWGTVRNDHHGCLAKQCHFFNRCPYFDARKKVNTMDVIIANHDFVLSDINLGGGKLLPDPKDSIYVFDEAHQLPAKAIEHGTAWSSTHSSTAWLDTIEPLLKQIEKMLPNPTIIRHTTTMRSKLIKLTNLLQTANSTLTDLLQSKNHALTDDNKDNIIRFKHGLIPPPLKTIAQPLRNMAITNLLQLETLKDSVSQCVATGELSTANAESITPELGASMTRLENMANLWKYFIADDDISAPPTARWISQQNFQGKTDLRLHAAPVSAAEFLYQHLWQHCYGAVLTSATLTGLDSFDRFRQKSGLSQNDAIRCLKLESPFNYPEVATLWLPWMDCDPTDYAKHTQAITEILPKILAADGGSLVLFASYAQMMDVQQDLPEDWQKKLRVQNTLPKSVLIHQHQASIEAGDGSILFGLNSFAEGIDLPGELCTHVVIAKLPFAVPDSPVEATEREYMQANGGNHFMQVAVPEASTRLVQAVGRLLRKETDYGTVTILDRRLINKVYGKQLLQSLPPMRIQIDQPSK